MQGGQPSENLLNYQDSVGIAARELAEVVIQIPVANAGPDDIVETEDNEVKVTLDATGSEAFGGRTVERYYWRFSDAHLLPVADSGLDHTVITTGENESVMLDAGDSQAYGGKEIVRYHWQIRESVSGP